MTMSKLADLLEAYVERWEAVFRKSPPPEGIREELIPSLGPPPNTAGQVERMQQRLGFQLPSFVVEYLLGPRVDADLQGAGLVVPGNHDLDRWESLLHDESFNSLGFAECAREDGVGDLVMLDFRGLSSKRASPVLIVDHERIFGRTARSEGEIEAAVLARFDSFADLLSTVCLGKSAPLGR